MKGFVETVVGGAIGLTALYVVGKVAFQAGYDIAEAECRYEQLQRGIEEVKKSNQDTAAVENSDEDSETPAEIVPERKQSKLGMLFGLRKLFGRKSSSVVGDLLQNPENHVIEACVKGREIHVNVKPRTA